MSRMKHLLRKLHIGGGGGGSSSGGVDHQPPHHPHPHQHQRLGGEARRNPSPTSASSSRARAQDVAPAEAVESREGSRSDGAAIAGPDYSLFEEEYQVQLALAISTSDPDGLEDADSVQIKAAKRMSMGCPSGVGATAGAVVGVGADDYSSMEFLSLRYWSFKVVNYDEKLLDGFYEVYGFSSANIVEKMPSLVDLQAISISDKIDYEVILVNRTSDYTLQQLEKQAVSILMESKPEEHGLLASGLVQKIADLVVCNMGGPVDDTNDIQRKWTLRSCELQNSLNTIVLPLGSLEIGLSRHRALLFKVLADRINLPCKLVKGSCYAGTDEGAVNFIKVDYGSEYIVDLMGAPGTLIPTENPSTHMENSINFLLGPETIEQTVQDLCLVLNKVDPQFERKSDIFERDLDNSLPSGYTGLQLEERSILINRHDDVDDLIVNSQIAGSDIEPGSFCSFLSRPQLDTSKPTEVISSSRQMKVNDVSKYVVTAAKNPEFAQKLHAVLLESGASPPPDLFSDLNSSLNLVEQAHNMDIKATGGRIGLELTGMNTTSNIQSSISPVLIEECSNNSDKAEHNENVAEESVHNMGEDVSSTRMSSSLAMKNDWLTIPNFQVNGSLPDNSWTKYNDPILDNLVTSKTSFMKEVDTSPTPDVVESINKGGSRIVESSGVHYYKENLGRDSAPDGHQKVPFEDCQESAKDSMFKQKSNLHALAASDNEKSSKILDAVSEWEIHWEDLQIGERIGLGSYGEVYRADWNGTEVAVKKLLDQDLCGDALEQFRYEVKIMSRLRHPNVVLFMGAVTRPPNLSILTEFLPRGSLYRLLHRPNSQLDEKRRLKMALDVAKGMNYLHSSHPTIVHRDLKSPNLLVDKNWVVKACDFGLSRLKHHTFLSSNSTSGTPEWMAPEVLRNEPSNEKCDVYSFGVILWELATLRKPWSGMNSMQVVGAVGFQNRRLEIPNDIDPVVAQIITDCWESDPNKRPSFSRLLSPLKQVQKLVVSN